MTVELIKIGCMELTTNSFCKRPVQYVFHGEKGPYYRCGKHGQELMRQRNDVEVTEYKPSGGIYIEGLNSDAS